jgi:hypothetical protein
MKYIGKLESVPLIRIALPPLDKYIIFQLVHRHSDNTIPNELSLVGGPQRKTEICQRQRRNLIAIMPANPSTSVTLPTEINSDLAKLTFKPETATKHKKKHRR